MPTSPSSRYLAALPDFLMAATALLTWIDPHLLGVEKVRYLALLMTLEFVVIHSAAFMGNAAFGTGDRAERARILLGFALFYTLFVGAFAFAFHEWWPLWGFWLLVVNRLKMALATERPDGRTRALVMAGWVAGMLFYLGSTMLTILLPLPRLGVSGQVAAAQHFGSMTGLWIDQPWRVVAMAMLYFTAQGIWTLRGEEWVARRQI